MIISAIINDQIDSLGVRNSTRPPRFRPSPLRRGPEEGNLQSKVIGFIESDIWG